MILTVDHHPAQINLPRIAQRFGVNLFSLLDMKFMKSVSKSTTETTKKPKIHIVDDKGKPLCGFGRSIDPKNRKYLKNFPPKGSVCKACMQRNEIAVVIPSVSRVKAEGQLLRNRPVPKVLIEPGSLRVGSTQLSPEGSKLLMLQLNPSGVTWYYDNADHRNKDIDKIRKSKL